MRRIRHNAHRASCAQRACRAPRAGIRAAGTCVLALALALAACPVLAACGGDSPSPATGGAEESTSGPAYSEPAQIATSGFDAAAATGQNDALIDTSHAAQGYVAASAVNANRLKLQVTCGDMSYNYDLPGDGAPIVCPLNMGNGTYLVRVMQNTSGSNYVEIAAQQIDVVLDSEFEPYLRPNVFCTYTDASSCVQLARELAADAQNEGDVVQAVYSWIQANISYDTDKAAELADATGYVPDPDATLSAGTGICFDYASLAAAMFRSLGIPCQIITGYVSPSGIYHAWNMVYIDGEWISVQIRVDANTWTRVDLTFAAAGASPTVGDGTDYTDRYVY